MADAKETFKLPTNGVLEGIPLEVGLRMMRVSEEKLMLGSSSDAVTDVLKACCTTPIDDWNKLTSADKTFLMVKHRIVSFGPEFPMNHRCSACGNTREYIINLDDQPVYYLPEDFKEPYAEVPLPLCGASVALKLPRIGDTEAADRKALMYMRRFPQAKGDISYVYRFMTNIYSVDGDTEIKETELFNFVENMPSADSSLLKDEIDDLKFGIDLKTLVECPVCGELEEITIRMNKWFFRARRRDGGR